MLLHAIYSSQITVSLGAEAKKMHRNFHLNDGPLSHVNINMHSKEVRGWAGFLNLA
jgi:hypothetical protein